MLHFVKVYNLNADIIVKFTEREYYASEGTGVMRIGVELNRESPQNIVLQLFITPITAEGNMYSYMLSNNSMAIAK